MKPDYTELELQTALQRILKDEICEDKIYHKFHWLIEDKVQWPEIRPTEWLEVVRRVELKLTDNEWNETYWPTLNKLCFKDNLHRVHCETIASWQQKATALMQIFKERGEL
jgi:hypothetical protein